MGTFELQQTNKRRQWVTIGSGFTTEAAAWEYLKGDKVVSLPYGGGYRVVQVAK